MGSNPIGATTGLTCGNAGQTFSLVVQLDGTLSALRSDASTGQGQMTADRALERVPPGPPAVRGGRVRSLDGLRGLAALVVVLHHALLTSVQLATPYEMPFGTPVARWASWLIYSPLHLLWAGPEAVLVFFVLSGFVLVLPFANGCGVPWRAYYPSRLVRLYLPVWAAIAFTLVTVAVAPRMSTSPMSGWMMVHRERVTAGYVGHDLLLIEGVNNLDTPLWTLQWELIFSLLLPVYVIIATRTRRLWLLVFVALLVVCDIGLRSGHKALVYLPVFGLGAVLAANRARIGALMSRWRTPAWVALAVTVALFLVANWTPIGHRRSGLLPMLGAALAVVVFLEWPAARRWGESRPLQTLGRWSFSLYLVHEPIVVTTALLLRTTNAAIVLAISLPLSLVAAAAFFRVIEGPAHTLSQRIRSRLAPQRDSPVPTVPTQA